MHYKNVILSKYMLMKYFHFYPGDSAKHCHFFFFFSSIPSSFSSSNSTVLTPMLLFPCDYCWKQLIFYRELSSPEQREKYRLLTCKYMEIKIGKR